MNRLCLLAHGLVLIVGFWLAVVERYTALYPLHGHSPCRIRPYCYPPLSQHSSEIRISDTQTGTKDSPGWTRSNSARGTRHHANHTKTILRGSREKYDSIAAKDSTSSFGFISVYFTVYNVGRIIQTCQDVLRLHLVAESIIFFNQHPFFPL